MFLGLDGVELSLIITFTLVFAGILSGFPVAFALGGASMIAFVVLASLDSSGYLMREVVNTQSDEYRALLAEGVGRDAISKFRYPDLPTDVMPLFEGGWEVAVNRNLSFIVSRIDERVLAGQSIETLLAVLMFVMMGITLERSHIANDLLTTMARVFGRLPGGLAVSVVTVGAFLAASTGIVGATVVTMGLLALPTMLRNGYSPELATGVIAASGTLGQIIPPSIVIVLLGNLAGDIYSSAQETRAQLVGCSDALTYLGRPAVLSVGTLFQAAILPGLMLASLYALYAFTYALINPSKAPAVHDPDMAISPGSRGHKQLWFIVLPLVLILAVVASGIYGVAGSQRSHLVSDGFSTGGPALRTGVSDQCRDAMIELHGLAAWDASVEAADARAAAQGGENASHMSQVAPLSMTLVIGLLIVALALVICVGVAPTASAVPIIVGGVGVALALVVDALWISPDITPGTTVVYLFIPALLMAYGLRAAVGRLAQNEILRVVFPPMVLIVAVLGSILGGITNPTPASALGAGGAIMLAAYRRQTETGQSNRIILVASFSIVILILAGMNFDLRLSTTEVGLERWIAAIVAIIAYHVAIFGFLFACWVLLRDKVLRPVVRETAKVTSMVFTILIGSQLLNLVIISFGGETYIQDWLRSFDREWMVFLIVMGVLFVLGFVLDFLEIIYIVLPIVGPVIYGGTLDPAWVTIMIAVNLQTSFLTPPFGFALFYLRGVAPPSVTTGHIYRGVVPFVLIQIGALGLLWLVPSIVTILPEIMK